MLVFLVVFSVVGCSGDLPETPATKEEILLAKKTTKDMLKNGIESGDYVISRDGYIYGINCLSGCSSPPFGGTVLQLKRRDNNGFTMKIFLSKDAFSRNTIQTQTQMGRHSPQDFLYQSIFVRIVRKSDHEYPRVAALFTSFRKMKEIE